MLHFPLVSPSQIFFAVFVNMPWFVNAYNQVANIAWQFARQMETVKESNLQMFKCSRVIYETKTKHDLFNLVSETSFKTLRSKYVIAPPKKKHNNELIQTLHDLLILNEYCKGFASEKTPIKIIFPRPS